MAGRHHPHPLDDGTLARHIADYSVTSLTSNPSIFDAAIGGGDACDAAIRAKTRAGLANEALFTLAGTRRPAPRGRLVQAGVRRHKSDRWLGFDGGFALMAADTAGSIAAARQVHDQARRANLFVKIPGTPQGVAPSLLPTFGPRR